MKKSWFSWIWFVMIIIKYLFILFFFLMLFYVCRLAGGYERECSKAFLLESFVCLDCILLVKLIL